MLSPALMSSPAEPFSDNPMTSRGSMPQLQRSLSWRHEAGPPPTPAEIDQYGDLQYALVPSQTPAPSAYDLRFGDGNALEEAAPINAVTKHPKLKLKILLSSNQYEAGDSISGALEVTSSTSQRLRLGEIAVELEAFEELTSRDHSATQIFLFHRTLFQGEHLPPSNAVLPAAPKHGHWTARKGRTTFPFSFHLPQSAPSSVTFAGSANLRYAIKGTAQTWWNDTRSVVTVRSDAFVVEKWQDEFDPRYLEPMEAVADTHIFMGGSGAVWLEAGISEQLFTSGARAMIRAGVKNNSKRGISGIKVAIARRLIIPASGPNSAPAQRQSLEPQITEVMHTQMFKGPQFEFPPGEEVVTSLPVEIPREIRTVRKTRLFEVHIVAQISAQIGNFAKDLTVEIPIYVAHPSSLRKPLPSGVNEPLRGLPQRSRSAMSQHGHHEVQVQSRTPAMPFLPQYMSQDIPTQSPTLHAHLPHPTQYLPRDPLMNPFEAYGADRCWSPAPPFSYNGMGPPSRPTSAAPNLESRQSPAPPSWYPSGGGEGSYPMFHSQSPHWEADFNAYQQQARPLSAMEIARSHSAAPEGRQRSAPRNVQDYTAGPLEASHEPFNQSSGRFPNIAPQTQQSSNTFSVSHDQPPSPSVQQPSAITMSQLLSLGAIPVAGLTTIEEDSESAAGTVKSIRTSVGTMKRDDIAMFEAMASQDEEERQITQPLPVAKSTLKEKRPRVSDLFETATKEETSTDPSPTPPKAAKSTPTRPASAQGQGLSALESRLRNTPKPECFIDMANVGKDTKRLTSVELKSREEEKSALREAAIAAAERERKAKKEANKMLKRDSEREEARRKERQDEAKANRIREEANSSLDTKNVGPSSLVQVSAEKAPSPVGRANRERKTVDVTEQKQLKEEGIGRIAGWLSSSPSRSVGLSGKGADDSNLSPSTPSPSVLRDTEVSNEKDGQVPIRSMLRGVNDGGDAGDVVPALSADLRALIDNSSVRPTPKQGTAIRSHIGSRRFSGEVTAKEEVGAKAGQPGSQGRRDVPSAASRGIPPNRKELVAFKKVEAAQGQEETKYDIRSARGGRGGRVASVANMWASIADGTDGSQMKSDDTPVLTLRPKALRSGAANSFKLDFSNKVAAGESKKPTARDIFSNPPTETNFSSAAEKVIKVASEGPLNPSRKTAKAAHFVNTTMPKPVFIKAASLSSPVSPASPITPVAVRKLSIEKMGDRESSPGKLSESRRVVSDRLAKEGKLKTGREICADKVEPAMLPMNGRGTTKAIGRDKLTDLRNMWGG